jgi:NAD/NADP octopine/nopaline dehydrogenase, alpha-helical domain
MIGKTTHRSVPPIPIDVTTGLLSPSSPAMSATSDSRPTARDMNRNGAEVTLKTAIAVSAENTKAIMAGFRGIKAQSELHHRYLTEDVGYSMVFLTDLARQLSVPTPTMDAVIHIASIVTGEDFAADRARTMDNVGLSGLTRQQLAAY